MAGLTGIEPVPSLRQREMRTTTLQPHNGKIARSTKLLTKWLLPLDLNQNGSSNSRSCCRYIREDYIHVCFQRLFWSWWLDLNQRMHGYEPCALTAWRHHVTSSVLSLFTRSLLAFFSSAPDWDCPERDSNSHPLPFERSSSTNWPTRALFLGHLYQGVVCHCPRRDLNSH